MDKILTFENNIDELLYFKKFNYKLYHFFNINITLLILIFVLIIKILPFFIDEEDEDEEDENENKDYCDFTKLREVKKYYQLTNNLFDNFKGSLDNLSNFLQKYMLNSKDSGKLYSLYKEYLYKCKEGKEYKKLLEKITIAKINKCNNIETLEKQPTFKSVEQIINYNEELPENEQIDLEVYIDSIKFYNLPSYLNQIEMLIHLLKQTIQNYNLYGNTLKLLKFLKIKMNS